MKGIKHAIIFIKDNWDIVGGVLASVALAYMSKLQLEAIQLYYSLIILALVSIGALRIIRQAIEKQIAGKKRKKNMIDRVIDNQQSIKAISLAQTPTKEGERVGLFVIKIMEVAKYTMKKFKVFMDKFKGHLLTAALAILTAVEMYGGFINSIFGNALTIGGIAVIPLVTLIAAVVVGLLSNGYSKEQLEQIKALFSKTNTNEIVVEEIKKTVKEKTVELLNNKKDLSVKEKEFASLKTEYEKLNKTLSAKKEMYAMTPRLATDEDVRLAIVAVNEFKKAVVAKEQEINAVKQVIETTEKTINALKSQL